MKRLLALALVALFTISSFAAEPPHQLTRIFIDSEIQIPRLLEFGLDIVTVQRGEYVEAVTIQQDIDVLQDAGFRLEIIIENMEAFYRARNTQDRLMGGFLTYTEMVARLNEIHNNYPGITTAPYSIGQSWENRDLWVIKVSDNPEIDEEEPEVWYDGLHHAREPIGMQLLVYFLQYVCENYGVLPAITQIVDERELFILPCVNPDGYCYNEQTNPYGGGMWRKNRRNNGGSYGVDLNRNYPFDWGHDNQGSSPTPSSETYRGPSPASEPETQAMISYINSRHIAISQSYHSYGNYVLYPWSGDYNGYTPDHPTFTQIASQFVSWNGYDPGTAWELLYNVNGGSIDWQYGQQDEHFKIMAFSFEVGGNSAGFWPSENMIPQLCQENLQPNIYTAQIADQYQPPSLMLTYNDMEIDDSAGNNNGAADPGEDINLTVILNNVGYEEATGIEATLSTTETYLTITSAYSTYPDIQSLGQGENNSPFEIEISASCPFGYEAELVLDVTADGWYATQLRFNLIVGDPMYLPSGPDSYGYLAYNSGDEPEMPQFEWVEISADSGGPGTRINFTLDEQVFHFALPFTFQYYGQEFDSLTIAANGWLGMGIITQDDYSNSGIPNSDGPAGMIASYWEDLSPQRTNSGGVWYWHDSVNHLYIVEYNHIEQYSPTGNFETFQTILYDPEYYQTATADGRIKVQYKTISSVAGSEGTVGIENPAENDGIQYLFDGNLDIHAAPLQNGLAILYTTPTETPTLAVTLTPASLPIVIPAQGGSFNYLAEIENIGTDPVTFDVWISATLPSGSEYGILSRLGVTLAPGAALSRNMTQNVPANAPAGSYTYHLYAGNYGSSTVWAEDFFPFSKEGQELGAGNDGWDIFGWDVETALSSLIPTEFSLEQNYPNPFNPETKIRFALPQSGKVILSVFNVAGQKVAELAEGYFDAGYHEITWKAANAPSGIYFYRIEAGKFTAVKKCILIK